MILTNMKTLKLLFASFFALTLSSCDFLYEEKQMAVGEYWEIRSYFINFGDTLKSTGLELDYLVFSHGLKEYDGVEFEKLLKGQGYVWGNGDSKRYEVYKVTGNQLRIDTAYGFVPMVYVAGSWEICKESNDVVILKDANREKKKLKEGEYEWIKLVREKVI